MSAAGERQYRQTLANQRRRPLSTAGSSPVVGRLVAGAARNARRLDEIEEAWRTVAEPEWLERSRIEGLTAGEVRVVVGDKSLHYQLSRMSERLARAMASVSPSVKSMRFAYEPAGGSGRRGS